MSIIGGVIAGILGFTGLSGFILYFLLMAITSVGLIAKAGFQVHSYFDSWNQVILDGFLGGLLSFVLFWTFAYDIVHIFWGGVSAASQTEEVLFCWWLFSIPKVEANLLLVAAGCCNVVFATHLEMASVFLYQTLSLFRPWPITSFPMNTIWLKGYIFRLDISFWTFLL